MVERADGGTTLALLFQYEKFTIYKTWVTNWKVGKLFNFNMLLCFYELNNAVIWFG